MNNTFSIEPGENESDAILRNIKYMLIQAHRRDEWFDEGHYKWKIGINILNALELKTCFYNSTLMHDKDDPTILYGIVVEIDFVNTFTVELWKNITDEL